MKNKWGMVVVQVVTLLLGSRDRCVPGIQWPASIADSSSSRLVKDLSETGLWFPYAHIQPHMYAPVFTQRNCSQRGKWVLATSYKELANDQARFLTPVNTFCSGLLSY